MIKTGIKRILPTQQLAKQKQEVKVKTPELGQVLTSF